MLIYRYITNKGKQRKGQFVIHNHEVAGSCPALATENQKVTAK